MGLDRACGCCVCTSAALRGGTRSHLSDKFLADLEDAGRIWQKRIERGPAKQGARALPRSVQVRGEERDGW